MAVSDILKSHELYLLSVVMETNHAEALKIASQIHSQTQIDIQSEEQLENLTPEQITSLKEFENENSGKLLAIILVAKDSVVVKPPETTPINPTHVTLWFAFVIVIISLLYVFLITFFPIPEDNVRFADTSLGFFLGTIVSTVVNYFFGNSYKSSAVVTSNKSY